MRISGRRSSPVELFVFSRLPFFFYLFFVWLFTTELLYAGPDKLYQVYCTVPGTWYVFTCIQSAVVAAGAVAALCVAMLLLFAAAAVLLLLAAAAASCCQSSSCAGRQNLLLVH